MKASLGMCARVCLVASPVLCCLSISLTQKLGKVLEVSWAFQMSECHMFTTLNEVLEFQNDLNRPGPIPQINA